MNMREAMARLAASLPANQSITITATLERPSNYNGDGDPLPAKSKFSIAMYGSGFHGSLDGNNLEGLVSTVLQRFGPPQDAAVAAECLTDEAGDPLGVVPVTDEDQT